MFVPSLTIVGVGLLGGSIALAARQRRMAGRVVGHVRSEASLARARACNLLDEVTTDLGEAVADADLVVVCTPVDVIARTVREAAALARPGTLFTDVGSTKAALACELAAGLPNDAAFVGSHPLAGSEKTGPEHARVDLFDNALVVVTPAAETRPAACQRVMEFWHGLGASVVPMPADEHDRALAMTSHLPHLIASALAATLPDYWRWLTATGFRDTTRVAAGSPDLWRAIFLDNSDSVLEAVDRFAETLAQFRAALATSDEATLTALLQRGKTVRDSLSR